MPRHDFKCPECGSVKEVTLPITLRATRATVLCEMCAYEVVPDGDEPASVRMEWIPPSTVGFDCGGGSTFTPFTTQIRQPDGSYRPITVSSVHHMRQIERETEQRARDGEGEAMRFRMWSHNATNGDVNAFGDDPSVQARKDLAQLRVQALEARGRRREARLSRVVGDEARKNAETLGPGVSEATTGSLVSVVE